MSSFRKGAVVGTLALLAASDARAEGAGDTVVLNTYSKVWVGGDALGPKGPDGAARLDKNTGAGIMDAQFSFDRTSAARAKYGSEVLLGTVYTRSATTPNANDSYMQGGFAVAKLTAQGVQPGVTIDFPQLTGERTFMRPQIAFTPKYVVLIAASEDNGLTNNPLPVMFLADKTTGALVDIPNSTRKDLLGNLRGGDAAGKPTNLIYQAVKDGLRVDLGGTRGPHSIVQVTDNSFIVGMQYNNQASYAMLSQVGYVAKTSRILQKGAHAGSTTNVLSAEQRTTFTTWVEMELKDGGAKAPPSVLEKLGTCLDKAKFDAIGLGDLRTIRRQPGNNQNNATENANNCTGCDNAPCRTCHSSDEGSGFVLAIGNTILPADYTFEQTKLTNPPYLQKYFGVSPTGAPIPSGVIKKKADATYQDTAYSHPMFKLSDKQEAALGAFIDDAVAKLDAGNCGK